jgi:hypothetical protein
LRKQPLIKLLLLRKLLLKKLLLRKLLLLLRKRLRRKLLLAKLLPRKLLRLRKKLPTFWHEPYLFDEFTDAFGSFQTGIFLVQGCRQIHDLLSI